MWFFNTIRGSKKWFCPAVTQKCDKCDRIAQYSFFFVTLFQKANILDLLYILLVINRLYSKKESLARSLLYKGGQ